MSKFSTTSTLHKRFKKFVSWIGPEPELRDTIKSQAKKIRTCISSKALEDGLIVSSTPNSGSFAGKTGLRRHYRGKSEVEGQDVDLPFVTNPETEDGKKLSELLSKFYSYVHKCYPDKEKEITKSSIKLHYSDVLSYDIVPMLATDMDDEQIIIRTTGEHTRTSVQKHVEFIRSRTRKSKELAGVVEFNECVRLIKWWREFQSDDSYYLNGDDAPPSFLINLLCAHAFDTCSIFPTYAETLATWFSFLAHILRNREPVIFSDYYEDNSTDDSTLWTVKDPVNTENNVVQSWTESKLNEFAEWFEKARDTLPYIIRYDEDGENNKSLEKLVELFGTPFKHHCED